MKKNFYSLLILQLKQILNIMKKKSNFSEIALNSHSKWDSLAHAKLLSAIEKKI